jgi:uncharacterized membrane protein
MFPIALALGWSRMEKRFSMGSIGGLISSLFLTLVIPVIYEIMEKLIVSLQRRQSMKQKWLLITNIKH